MKPLCAVILTAMLLALPATAEEDTQLRVMRALPYLTSPVPEQQQRAENLIRLQAHAYFLELEAALEEMHGEGRARLLRILVATEHERRVPLCVDMLTARDSGRDGRMHAWRALRSVDSSLLLGELERRLDAGSDNPFARMQLFSLLGTISSPRAQSLAERALQNAKPGTMDAFAAEDSLLRGILASPLAQPAFSRYQERYPAAPRVTLRQLQQALDDLAQPVAADRSAAETRLAAMIGGDARLLLALARSPWPERAAFALRRLKSEVPRQLQTAAQSVLVHLLETSSQIDALLALEVLIASRPPTAAEFEALRPLAGSRAISRIESILESMAAGGDLGELRLRNEQLSAKLRPLLLLRGPMDAEVQRLSRELHDSRRRLHALEQTWEKGWRREFEARILGSEGR